MNPVTQLCAAAARHLAAHYDGGQGLVARTDGQDALRVLGLPMPFITLFVLSHLILQSASAATLTSGYTIGSGLLGNSLIIDNASTGGGDSSSSSGDLGWTAELAGLWNSNALVSLTGIALPIWSDTNTSSTTGSGTFTFYFYDLDKGTNGTGFDGTSVETLLGTAAASFTQGAIGTYYAVFDFPVRFTAKSTGLAVRIVNTGWLRLKVNTAAAAPGVILKSSTTAAAIGGVNPNFRLSLAGTVFSPSIFPPRVNLAKYQAVTASTTNGQYLPGFVNDGLVNNNSWRTLNVNTPHWVEVGFPLSVTIASAHVYDGVDDGLLLSSCKLQYQSGTNWLDVPGAARSGNASSEVNLIFSSAVTSTAFRLYSDDNGTQRIKEVALFPPNPTNGVEQGYPIGTDVELNLAKKRPAVATAISGANYPNLAVDGFVDSASKWQTTLVGSNALLIDLRIAANIGSAHLYSGDGAVPPISNCVLQYWDGSAWQTISGGIVSDNTNAARVITFVTPVTTTSVQLVFTNSSISAVRELCIFPANGGVGYLLGQDAVSAPPPAQKWDDYNDAFYKVVNRAANLSASVIGGTPCLNATNMDAQLSLYQVLLNVGTDTYRLRNRVTGQCLAGAGLSTNAGALLLDQDYTAMPHQTWRLQPVDGTDFYLVNQWSGLVLDTQGRATGAGTPLVQSTNNGATSQRWRFVFQTAYPKKGLAGKESKWSEYKGNWAYNWGRTPAVNLPNDVIFNPMQWGNYNWDIGSSSGPVEQFMSAWQREDKAMYYLGFNEPDGTDQANLTVDKAIELWPRLERMDLPLISPVTTNPDNSWMTNFMAQANTRGYRMDALAAHKYPGPNGGDPGAVISELQSLSVKWGRPVWFTEFSTVDWAGTNKWTQEDNYNWLAEFTWRAESLPWLRRYSLFLFTANTTNYAEPTNPWDPVGPRSNAFDTNGTPTAFGELYFAWDCDANVRPDTAYFIHNKSDRKRIRNATGSSAPSVGTIRESTNPTQWVLRQSDVAGQYYIVSLRDGRRLRATNGMVDFAPAHTAGATVRWNWIEHQYGWFYLEHPASPAGSRRLRDDTGTFSMVANTTATNQVRWRFIVPYAPGETAPPASLAALTATPGVNQVSLIWNVSGAADFSFYSVYRSTTPGGGYSLIASNLASAVFTDTTALGGITYYYMVTATDLVGFESGYSNEAVATPTSPLPTAPTNITFAVSNHALILNWPANYTGWLLQAQTNTLNTGLGTNWFTLPGSETNSFFIAPLNPSNPAVFFRLKRP